ncbi:MAG: SsrA-binding protein SmpB [Veillonella caviae]|nr:SsrA-binding protein SmpB [Veillonella caviae]
MSKAKKDGNSLIADNRKARHDYHIHETFEAGIVLTGTEVKSIRQGRLNLKDSFCGIENGELFLYQTHISPYEQGNQFNHEPLRTRKLLMHRSEIHKLLGQVKEKGFSLVPLNFHFSHGLIKVTIGLVTGKKNFDKRQDMAERDAKRDIQRRMKEQNRDW